MSDRTEFQNFLEKEESSSNPSKETFTEIPPPLPPRIDKALAGYSPMEQIEIEGQVYRGLTSGHIPWWVILSGWIVFGLPCLGVVIVAVTSGDLYLLLPFIPVFIVLWIVWRGTQAKRAAEREKAQRIARRRGAMRE
jgi:hypothetical protein